MGVRGEFRADRCTHIYEKSSFYFQGNIALIVSSSLSRHLALFLISFFPSPFFFILEGGSPSLFAWFNFLDILLPFPTQRLPLPFRSTPSSQRYTFLSLFFSIPTAFAVPFNATAEFNGRHAPLYPPQNKAEHIPRWSVDPFFFWKQFRLVFLSFDECKSRNEISGTLIIECLNQIWSVELTYLTRFFVEYVIVWLELSETEANHWRNR